MEFEQAQKDLREKFLREAQESIKGVEKESNILAAILTGSAAWGRPNPDGDLDILLITQPRRGVVYRYLIPKFCPVQRRTELGYIPYETAVQNIKKGYGNLISCSLIEQLKNGRVLFQRGSQGDDLTGSCQRVHPNKLIIGESINDIKEVLKAIRGNLDQSLSKEAILTIRRVIQLSARALLLARENTGVAKEKHEYRAVKRYLKKGEARKYEELMGVKGITQGDARRIVGRTIDLMKWLLQQWSISPELVNYDRKRKRAQGNSI